MSVKITKGFVGVMQSISLLIRYMTPVGMALLAGCQSLNHPAWDMASVTSAPYAMHKHIIDPMDDVIGAVQVTRVREEDTLSDIARRFNVGYEEIISANPGVDPWIPKAGTDVIIPTEFVLPDTKRTGVVINLAAMRLFYFPKAEPGEPQYVITHPIGIGRVGWRTPLGSTTIVSKTEAPSWIPTRAIRREHEADGDPLPKVVLPGPDNPMGTHALKLGWPEYAIHGTDKPPSIGLRGTHGCLRLYPEDIVVIYDAVPVGTPVTIVNQPFLVGWRGNALVMQAYPVLEDDKRNHQRSTRMLIRRIRKSIRGNDGERAKVVINRGVVTELTQNPRAVAVPISDPNLTLQKYLIAALRVENKLPKNATWDGKLNRQQAFTEAMRKMERCSDNKSVKSELRGGEKRNQGR